MTETSEQVFFLYGSETGNCESIAKQLHHQAVNEKGYETAECMTLNQAVTKKILNKQLVATGGDGEADGASDNLPSVCIVIVCSTTGEGEPPENASRFRRWLRNTKDGKLCKVRYTVLALGDTNYNNFCAAGQYIDGKLSEFGATRFYPRGEADDGIGLEVVVDPWTEGLWGALASAKAGAETPAPAVDNDAYQATADRVDMAVAMETAIIYSNASQICATVALFMYERIMELGGSATLYPIQYFSPEKVHPAAEIVLFVLCTDSDEHTLCEHCRAAPRQPPLGSFAELLTQPGIPTAQLSTASAELSAWLGTPSVRFGSSISVAPKMGSVPHATALSDRVRNVAKTCKLERLSKRQPDDQVNVVAVSEDDVAMWVETVLDNLPGVTADAATIAEAVHWFFDSRVGAAFRDAYAADVGLGSVTEASTLLAHGPGAMRRGSVSLESRHSAGTASSRLQKLHHLRLHSTGNRPDGTVLRGAAAAVDGTNATGGGNVGDGNVDVGEYSDIRSIDTGVSGQRGGGRGGSSVKDDDERALERKLLNEYVLTPVVFLYSGNEFVSQIASDVHAGAAAHHLRSSIADLTNFGHTGFPRRATFVFVVGGSMTKAMLRLFKTLRAMQRDGKSISGVKFALLGVDETSRNEKFNVCVLELETLLLSLNATKIHCTGLADLDSPDGLQPVLNAWTTNLWGAILYPVKSAAYLDAGSPNVCAGNVPALPGGSDTMSGMLRSTAPDSYGSPQLASGGGRTGPGSEDVAMMSRLASNTVFSDMTASILPDMVGRTGAGSGPFNTTGVAGMATAEGTGRPGAETELLHRADRSGAPNGSGASTAVGKANSGTGLTAPLFPWDSVPLNRDNAQVTPLAFMYSSSGMAKTVAVHSATSAAELGFPTSVFSFANFDQVDMRSTPNVILFCESGPDGQSSGGKRFRKFLLRSSHKPDHLSHVRFAVLGLGPAPPGVDHPAFTWSNMLSRLQASRVFPVVIMPSLSHLHSLGIPWCECVCATLALRAPPPLPLTSGEHPPGGPASVAAAATGVLSGQGHHQQQQIAGRPAMSVLFLYGSSTGLAEAVARDLHMAALEKGYASRIAALNYYDRMDFVSSNNIVIICSTVATNPGGFPENARRFAKYILNKSQPANLLSYSDTRFALLGLDNGFGLPRDAEGIALADPTGSRDAANGDEGTAEGKTSFCRPTRRMDKRLRQLGWKALCPPGFVDVSLALAEPVEEWRRQLFGALSARETDAIGTPSRVCGRPVCLKPCTPPPPTIEGAVVTTHGPSSNGAAHDSSFVAGVSKSDAARAGVSCEGKGLCTGVLIAYASAPTSAVPGIVTHVERMIKDVTRLCVDARPMSALTETQWRNTYNVVVFILASRDADDIPLNGSAFLRLVRQKNNPVDLYADVWYSVLAVSDTNERCFDTARGLDRRMEELGATRFYARGEAVDSFSLEKTVERWIGGLLNALDSLQQCAEECGASRADGEGPAQAAGKILGSTAVNNALPGTTGTVNSNDETAHSVVATVTASDLIGRGGRTASDAAATALASADRSLWHADRGETSVVSNVGGVADRVNSDVCEGVVHSWKRLTSDAVEEPVVLMNLAVCSETTHWEPGQTVAVTPTNDLAVVEQLLARLGVRADEPFHPLSITGTAASSYPTSPLYSTVDFPVSCGTVLLRYVSLRLSKANKTFFTLLSSKATTTADRNGVEELVKKLSASRRVPLDLLELLLQFPGIPLQFRHVVEHLSMLQPRVYSIASSSTATPGTLSLCFKVVQHGLCTNWMYGLCRWADGGNPHLQRRQNELVVSRRRAVVRFSVRAQTEFRMPRDPLIPLVLIGPGTGISPFRGFLQERAAWLQRRRGGEAAAAAQPAGDHHQASGEGEDQVPHGAIDLYFGCRRATEDYLFHEELYDYAQKGILNSLNVAYSREANEGTFWYGGCYVQDRLMESAVGVAELITQRGARVYVCGDAESMAKEVHQCLIDIVQQHLCVQRADAVSYVEGMAKSGRYIRDVWTITPP